jgi:sugar-specific transcriptional regulator TrmB
MLFDILWSKAIPAEERIKELEKVQKLKHEFVETISDPSKIKIIYEDLILSATKELLIIFPSAEFLVPLAQLLQKTNSSKTRILASMDKLENLRHVGVKMTFAMTLDLVL